MHHHDIIVAGGGPGGLAAAVAAARNGADTLLVEQYGFLGGNLTAGYVNPFMAYHAGGEQLVTGIFQEMIERLQAIGGWNGDPRGPRAFDPELMKIVADQLCRESGVKLLLHTFVGEAEVKDDRIARVQVANKSGSSWLSAQVFIDGTGDADLAARSGAPCEKGRSEDGFAQPMTLNFQMANIDMERMPPREEINTLYDAAKARGEISCPRENVLWFYTTHAGVIHFNTTRVIMHDGTDAEQLTDAEVIARQQVSELVPFLKRDVPGFENAYLSAMAACIGVRESRRIVGEYVMTEEDVLSASKFPDVIARGNYNIDIHNPAGGGTVIKHLPPGASYDIPYRCLVPLKIENLLIAGRPISTTHEAHSSIRIMPICMGIGQAAGTAAALCTQLQTSPRQVPVERLQRILREQGANLG